MFVFSNIKRNYVFLLVSTIKQKNFWIKKSKKESENGMHSLSLMLSSNLTLFITFHATLIGYKQCLSAANHYETNMLATLML